MKKELLSNNPCPENWNAMLIANNGRVCDKCNTFLADLTEKTIEDIAKNHYGKQKCVSLTNEQIDFFINVKRIKQISVAASLFLGTAFFNPTFAQGQPTSDSCLVNGIVIDFQKAVIPYRSVLIYIKESDAVFETKTNEQGKFQINLPKDCEIRYSNVTGLVSKKTKKKKTLNVGKVKLAPKLINPGFL